MERRLVNLSELPDFASMLASELRVGVALLLYGPLGAGKTTLARLLIQAMAGTDIEVQSPTFPICLTYDTPRGTVWHYDLYRLPDGAPLDDLGWWDARDTGIAIIEWPERAASHYLKTPIITVTLDFTDVDTQRSMSIERTT